MRSYEIQYKEFVPIESYANENMQEELAKMPFAVNTVEIVAENPIAALEMLEKEMKVTRGFIIDVFEKTIVKLDRKQYII